MDNVPNRNVEWNLLMCKDTNVCCILTSAFVMLLFQQRK